MLLLTVIHAHQDLKAVARDDALAAMKRAEPPAVQSLRVALQHGHDVALTEGQLVWGLGHIVVQSLGQHVLQDKMEMFTQTVSLGRYGELASPLTPRGFPLSEYLTASPLVISCSWGLTDNIKGRR